MTWKSIKTNKNSNCFKAYNPKHVAVIHKYTCILHNTTHSVIYIQTCHDGDEVEKINVPHVCCVWVILPTSTMCVVGGRLFLPVLCVLWVDVLSYQCYVCCGRVIFPTRAMCVVGGWFFLPVLCVLWVGDFSYQCYVCCGWMTFPTSAMCCVWVILPTSTMCVVGGWFFPVLGVLWMDDFSYQCYVCFGMSAYSRKTAWGNGCE